MPVIQVVADTLPEAWERAVIKCWEEGERIKTEYDKPGDPESRDCVAVITVRDPMREPRIHKAFPSGYVDLEMYRLEVVEGIHDHWVDPDAGKWSYTYHQRLFEYPSTEHEYAFTLVNEEVVYVDSNPVKHYKVNESPFDQIDAVVDKLADAPHTRRAQAITWIPQEDAGAEDPPCLQRLWFRIVDNKLRMNVHIRSNDAYKAGYMNMFAFISIQEYVAKLYREKTGNAVGIGEYNHIADSFHIYGSYFDEFSGFLDSIKARTFEERTMRSDDPLVQECFESTCNQAKNEKGLSPQEVNALYSGGWKNE